MNIKFCVAAVIALSAAVFAADEVVPAEAPVAATEESVAEEQAPATSAPAAVEAAAPAAEEPAAPPAVAETPAEPVQEPAPEAVSSPVVEGDEVPAPMAVRGVPADAPAGYPYAEQPQSAAPARHKLEPVPMAFSAGVQAFVGMSNLYDNNWSLTESYDGAEWKAGAFVLIPLNEYTMGFRLGAFYSRSETSASYAYSSDYSKEAHLKFKQDRVDVPLLFVLKPSYSRFMIDLGAQVSFPVRDVFKYSYEKSNGEQVSKKADMIDLDYRASMDFALVFGFSIRANQYISFDLRTDCGFSNSYEGVPGWRINDLSRTSLLLGLSIYAF